MEISADDMNVVLKKCRANVFDVLEVAGLGHSGGSLSVLELLVALYFKIANVDPRNPNWSERDRIILSKAHACEALYAVLAERGFFRKEMLTTYLRFGSNLQGHAERCTPGVEFSGGSLGQGISFACGCALAGKLRNLGYRVFCVLGDAELHEGQVWEAAMFASHYRLDNLFVIVDYNHFGDHDDVDKLMNLQPLTDKWASFGWETRLERSGNDLGKLVRELQSFQAKGKPHCLIADTVKNHGVPRWEKLHLHQVAGAELVSGLEEGRNML